jgi:hypothetical protein
MPVSTLAAKGISAHLMDARRRCRLHVVVTASTTTTSLKFPRRAHFRARITSPPAHDVREIQV